MKKIILLITLFLFFIVNVKASSTNISEINAVFIGDSYCTGYNYDDEKSESIKHGWAAKVVDKLGIENAVISCKNGTGFMRKNGEIDYFALLRSVTSSEGLVNTDVNLVVIAGGYNDHPFCRNKKDQDKFISTMNDFIKETKESFPNAKIIMSSIGWSISTNKKVNITRDTISSYMEESYKKVAETNEILLIENGYNVLKDNKSYFSKDNLHPIEKGYEAIADLIVDFINNNIDYEVYEFTPPNSIFQFIKGNALSIKNINLMHVYIIVLSLLIVAFFILHFGNSKKQKI